MKKKKKHHFVSQFYLRSWAKTDDRLYTNIGNEIHPKKTNEVGAENYFYRIKSLNKNQFDLLTRENSFLPDVPIRSLLKTIIHAGIFFRLESALSYTDREIANLEARQANLVENCYCLVEDCVSEPHKKLLNSNYAEINIEDYENIVRFMFNQLTRTQKAKNNVKAGISEILEKRGIEFEAYHIVSALILSERMTLAAIEKLSTLTILENETGINFITNDSPVLNLKTPNDKNIKLYWPISPNRALLLEDSSLSVDEQKKLKEELLKTNYKSSYFIKPAIQVDEPGVVELNQKIWANKNRNAFGVSPTDLCLHL